MAGGSVDVRVDVVIPTRNEEAAIVDTIKSVPTGEWCRELGFIVVDGNSEDRTRELAENVGARVHLEGRRGYGRAYRTGFALSDADIIVTMDADCTYPGEEIPSLVKMLIDEDLDFITCDRLSKAEDGSMSMLHSLGNKTLTFFTRLLFFAPISDSQSGMWVFRRSILDRKDLRPKHDGMAMSQEFKIRCMTKLASDRRKEVSVPYRSRVGDAEINTWRDGLGNLLSLFTLRMGLTRERTPWGLDDS